jgi:hypothetical protein
VRVPDPVAVDAMVGNDPTSRTLTVKPAESGSATLLWRRGVGNCVSLRMPAAALRLQTGLPIARLPLACGRRPRPCSDCPWCAWAGRSFAVSVSAGETVYRQLVSRQLVSTPALRAYVVWIGRPVTF